MSEPFATALAVFGYDWKPSSVANGGVGTHASGYKVAVDLDSGEWCYYRGRGDPTKEGIGRRALVNYLTNLGS
jgi:hypothetical protein